MALLKHRLGSKKTVKKQLKYSRVTTHKSTRRIVTMPWLTCSSPNVWTRPYMNAPVLSSTLHGKTSESTFSPTHSLATPKRSEEHTSELQSRENIVCRLLLE